MNKVKNALKYGTPGLGLVGSAFATDPTVADAQTSITGAATSAGTVAGAFAAVFVGIAVYRWIKKAANKASS